jgi:hypothetical protein
MATPVKEIATTASKAAGSFREAVQDLLVPELRALKSSVESLRTEMQLRDEKQTKALEDQGKRLTQAIESLTSEMRLRDEQQRASMQQLSNEMRLRDEQQRKSNDALSQKLDFAIDIRERLASVEARLPKQ